ncbi:hypothetical protein [Methanosphaerula palustris]|uniref:Uncharacterized protein n=1 Tax=Methanosphaerula palustris (strain ATCC BAA-1556 / DSM 19958 / E1-9c) TaxID=521011 RepID=B8GFH2_METPE|nr:hypothetical protein [Methanosphaerula palustris]ACL16020.1 hypothetical protein Mpal_0650 [Methanosphaerula palustris E1-9c]
MNCINDEPGHHKNRSARWTWIEIGLMVLYWVAIGVSIAIALVDLKIKF